jgi:hypothetical protein
MIIHLKNNLTLRDRALDRCAFCDGLENGKPVSLCSRCVQRLLITPAEDIELMKQDPDVKEAQLHFLDNISDEEETIYEFKKTRKFRPALDRSRIRLKTRTARA